MDGRGDVEERGLVGGTSERAKEIEEVLFTCGTRGEDGGRYSEICGEIVELLCSATYFRRGPFFSAEVDEVCSDGVPWLLSLLVCLGRSFDLHWQRLRCRDRAVVCRKTPPCHTLISISEGIKTSRRPGRYLSAHGTSAGGMYLCC